MKEVDVVIIDDDEGVRWVLQEVLSAHNITCCMARNGLEGLNKVAECNPRLAIVDIKLGGMNGLEVARRLWAREDNQVQVLFITGYNEAIQGKVEKHLPYIGVIEKPFDVDHLLKTVQQTLSANRFAAESSATYTA